MFRPAGCCGRFQTSSGAIAGDPVVALTVGVIPLGKDSHKTQIIVATTGLIGVLGAAVISNWGNIFSGRSADRAAPNAGEQGLALHPSSACPCRFLWN